MPKVETERFADRCIQASEDLARMYGGDPKNQLLYICANRLKDACAALVAHGAHDDDLELVRKLEAMPERQ